MKKLVYILLLCSSISYCSDQFLQELFERKGKISTAIDLTGLIHGSQANYKEALAKREANNRLQNQTYTDIRERLKAQLDQETNEAEKKRIRKKLFDLAKRQAQQK